MIGPHGEPIEMPSNAELKTAFDSHAIADQIFQEAQIKANQTMTDSLASLHKKLNDIPNNEQTADIVTQVISDLLLKKGKSLYGAILVTAGVVGAVAIILGGFNAVLGWIGFTQLKP